MPVHVAFTYGLNRYLRGCTGFPSEEARCIGVSVAFQWPMIETLCLYDRRFMVTDVRPLSQAIQGYVLF